MRFNEAAVAMHAQRHDPRAARRGGATLVELIVAMVLLTIGVGALASTSAYVLHEISTSRRAERAAILARSRLDELRLGPCTSASGTRTHGELTERWSVTGADHGAHATVTISYRDRERAREQRYDGGFPC